ncbi:MAG: T9SS type A sorting domain-containing protein [Bacteroidetes bacterium]|nr:T9SS type A sorting domain-containing protein [Bacteroidota bacterium]
MKTPLSLARLWLCTIAIAATILSQAQNLVVNPSFETTSGCPQGISQFSLATGWSQGNSGADSCTTSDLYAGCASSIGGANSPAGLLGNQPSRTGTHHAGIILQEGFVGCAALGSNYREYIQGQLTSPMVAGQKYVVKFYVSLPENVMWASSDFQVWLGNNQYTHNACPSSQLMPITPQLSYCGPAVMDTVNWVELKWIYTATGGEQFFIIGNFRSDANSNSVPFKCGSFNPYAYYYIDDVEISPAAPNECAFAVATASTKTNCNAPTGTANALANGCTTPFNYVWSNAQNGVSISNVAAGNYTVTVTDANNCSLSASVTVAAHVPPTVTVSTVNASCGSSNGSAIAGVSGGTAPYTYAWSNSQTGPTASNLGAGTYTVTVTATGNCTASASAAVTAGSGGFSITPSVTAAGCGAANGTATATPSAPGTYTYAWSNGQTTQTATGLAAGTYTVTVTPGAGGSATPFFTENFTGGAGSWTLNVAGAGTNGAQPNQWVVNSDAECTCGSGNYLHITCGGSIFNGCPTPGECTYSAGFPAGFPLGGDVTTDRYAVSPAINTTGKTGMVLSFSYMVDGQPGLDYGQVAFSSNGGSTWTVMPTQYQGAMTCTQATVNIPNNFENQANFRVGFRWINNNDADGDAPGFVIDDIQITSGGGQSCPAVTQITVGSNGGLTMNASSTNASCGLTNGTATAAVTAGTPPYTYAWSTGASTQSIGGLTAGTYNVTVTGQGGCSATASTTVSATAGLSVSTTSNSASCGANNGTATASVTSGSGPYTYAWSNSLGSTQTVSNLGSGTYTVTVTGQGGCSATASVVVSATPGVAVTASAVNAGCGNGGSVTANVTAGTGPYTYVWNNNQTTSTINVGAGTYTVTVTGQGGCTATATATVTSAANLTATFSVTQPSCGGNNGSITCLNVSGVSPINVTWTSGGSNVGNTYTISNLAGGTYQFHAQDANGCTIDTSFVLNGGGGLGSVPVTIDQDTLCSGDTATLCAPAGYANYQWNNGATTQCVQTRFAGNYYVTVTDAGNCTASSLAKPVAVRPLPPVSVTVNGDTMTSFNAVSYQWFFNGQPIPNATGSQWIAEQSGTYTVQITDINGCHATSNPISMTRTGIDVVVLENMKVYPNPSALRGWYLEVDASLIGSTAEVYDYNGRLMYSNKLSDVKTEIEFSAAQGVYVLKITNGERAISQKIIKL